MCTRQTWLGSLSTSLLWPTKTELCSKRGRRPKNTRPTHLSDDNRAFFLAVFFFFPPYFSGKFKTMTGTRMIENSQHAIQKKTGSRRDTHNGQAQQENTTPTVTDNQTTGRRRHFPPAELAQQTATSTTTWLAETGLGSRWPPEKRAYVFTFSFFFLLYTHTLQLASPESPPTKHHVRTQHPPTPVAAFPDTTLSMPEDSPIFLPYKILAHLPRCYITKTQFAARKKESHQSQVLCVAFFFFAFLGGTLRQPDESSCLVVFRFFFL